MRIFWSLLLLPAMLAFSAAPLPAEDLSGRQKARWRLPPPSKAEKREIVELGRMLFFDSRLSADGMRSCASCHHPGYAWAYPGSFLHGRSNMFLSRKVPSLLNIRFYRRYFWDAREDSSLEAAISQHLEVLLPELPFQSGYFEWTYQALFQQAFGEADTSRPRVARALAAFLRSIPQAPTPFDRWIAGERKAIDKSARQGFALFLGKAGCARCHTPPGFTDSKIHNIGLDSMDPGYYEISRQKQHHNAFRTPSLRQVGHTPPYMHDGSYQTLREVIEHYNRGGQLRGGGNDLKPLHLSPQEMGQLEAFLRTLDSRQHLASSPWPLLPVTVR